MMYSESAWVRRTVGYTEGCWGAVECAGVGVYHRAHWRYGPIPSHGGLTEMCRGAQCAAGALGLDPALREACPAAPLTTLHPDLRVGGPTPPSLSLGPEPCDQGRPLWSGRGPPLCKDQEGAGVLPTAPPSGPSPGRVQTAAAGTLGLFHMLWVEQALGSDEYFKHFSKMMGSPAPGRAVSQNFQGDRGINFCVDQSWSLVRGGGCSEPPL